MYLPMCHRKDFLILRLLLLFIVRMLSVFPPCFVVVVAIVTVLIVLYFMFM